MVINRIGHCLSSINRKVINSWFITKAPTHHSHWRSEARERRSTGTRSVLRCRVLFATHVSSQRRTHSCRRSSLGMFSIVHPVVSHSTAVRAMSCSVAESKGAVASSPSDAVVFDRSQFRREVHVVVLKVPVPLISTFVKFIPKNLFAHLPGQRHIIPESKDNSASAEENKNQKKESRTHMLILLDEKFKGTSVADLTQEGLPDAALELITKHSIEVRKHGVLLEYSSFSYEEVLRTLLPPEVGVPTGFETVGHIAHLNLRDEQLPHRFTIGAVIVDKMQNIETVVTKVGTISNQFRVFDMEIIGGRRDLVTVVREHGCTFHFDFSKVYWNSRLQTEHQRTVNAFHKEDVVGDMFCGVGPFAIPAGKKGCVVYANDLNPESVKYLRQNIKANKVAPRVHPFNMDARAFMRHMAEEQRCGRVPYFQHAVMNLPATAIEFLDVFRGLYPEAATASNPQAMLPCVHCYCFSSAENAKHDVETRVCAALGVDSVAGMTVRLVRNVAPSKDMFCASFPLPPGVAAGDNPLSAESKSHEDPSIVKVDSGSDPPPAADSTDVGVAAKQNTEPAMKKAKMGS